MLKQTQTQGGGVKVYNIVDDDREILIERLDPCVAKIAKIAKISCMTEDRRFITPSCTSSSPHHLITSSCTNVRVPYHHSNTVKIS